MHHTLAVLFFQHARKPFLATRTRHALVGSICLTPCCQNARQCLGCNILVRSINFVLLNADRQAPSVWLAQAQEAEARKRKRPKAPVGLGQLAAKKKKGTKGVSGLIDKWAAVRKDLVGCVAPQFVAVLLRFNAMA